jgi:hypothetical protein
VTSITPDRIKVITSRLLPVSIPIEILTENKPPPGIIVESMEATPASVKVLIPHTLRNKRVRILTDPIDLSLLADQRVFTASLRHPVEVQFPGGKKPTVRVAITTGSAAPAAKR